MSSKLASHGNHNEYHRNVVKFTKLQMKQWYKTATLYLEWGRLSPSTAAPTSQSAAALSDSWPYQFLTEILEGHHALDVRPIFRSKSATRTKAELNLHLHWQWHWARIFQRFVRRHHLPRATKGNRPWNETVPCWFETGVPKVGRQLVMDRTTGIRTKRQTNCSEATEAAETTRRSTRYLLGPKHF